MDAASSSSVGDVCLQKGAGDNYIKHADSTHHNHNSGSVSQTHIFYQQVGGNHATAKIHGNSSKKIIMGFFAREVVAGQWIADSHGKHHIQHGAQNGIYKGVIVSLPDASIGKNLW